MGVWMLRFPVAITFHLYMEDVDSYKKTYCKFYDDCVDTAAAEDWPNFTCQACNSYKCIDVDQKVQDFLGLSCVYKAIELMSTQGKLNRIRGVKPGAECKSIRQVHIPLDKAPESVESDYSPIGGGGKNISSSQAE